MKITKTKLKQIIKEELEALNEDAAKYADHIFTRSAPRSTLAGVSYSLKLQKERVLKLETLVSQLLKRISTIENLMS